MTAGGICDVVQAEQVFLMMVKVHAFGLEQSCRGAKRAMVVVVERDGGRR